MLAQVRSEEGMRRGALFGNGIGQRDGAPTAATVAERSGAWTGKTEKRPPRNLPKKITFWTPLETVTVRSASRANWDKAAHSECEWLALDKKTPQQLHSGKEQLRPEP